MQIQLIVAVTVKRLQHHFYLVLIWRSQTFVAEHFYNSSLYFQLVQLSILLNIMLLKHLLGIRCQELSVNFVICLFWKRFVIKWLVRLKLSIRILMIRRILILLMIRVLLVVLLRSFIMINILARLNLRNIVK